MIRWRAQRPTYGNDDRGKHYPIVTGTIVLTHTEPGLKETVYFEAENNPDLQLMLHGDQFRSDFEGV